jgi:hypothetical protein
MDDIEAVRRALRDPNAPQVVLRNGGDVWAVCAAGPEFVQCVRFNQYGHVIRAEFPRHHLYLCTPFPEPIPAADAPSLVETGR